jgi:hypothetical protein
LFSLAIEALIPNEAAILGVEAGQQSCVQPVFLSASSIETGTMIRGMGSAAARPFGPTNQ